MYWTGEDTQRQRLITVKHRIETNKETYLEAGMLFVVLVALSKETIENIAVIG